MEIKKNYDAKGLAGKLRGRIKISNESDTRFVDIDILTAVRILDVLEEIGRMEKEGKKGKTEEKTMFRQCIDCLMKDKGCNRDCKNERITAKMLRDRTGCFGDYDSTDGACGKCKYLEFCREWRAKKEPCFGCYDDENFDSDCPECEYSIVCRRATNNA